MDQIRRWISAIVLFLLAAVWILSMKVSISDFLVGDHYSWNTFAWWLVFLVSLSAVLILLLWPKNPQSEIKRTLISSFISTTVVIFWIIGPLQSAFALHLTSRQISFAALEYFLEVAVLGGVFIFIALRWFREFDLFLKDYSSNVSTITKDRIRSVSNSISYYPLRISLLGFFISFGGYLLGDAMLVVFAGANRDQAIKDLLVALAMSPIAFLTLYSFGHWVLQKVNGVLASFGDILEPKAILPLKTKIMFLGFSSIILGVVLYAPLVWNFIEGHLPPGIFYLGLAITSLEVILIVYVSSLTFSADLTESLSELKRGLEVLQSDDKNYRINIKTGDEIEEAAYAFNRAAESLSKHS